MSLAAPILIAFVIIGVVVAVAIRGANRAATRTNRAWGDAAAALGIHLVKGSWAKGPKLTGDVRNFPVKVEVVTESTGNSSRRYSRYQVRWEPLRLGLEMKRQGSWQRFSKLFGAQDVVVGDRDFDDAITVKGKDEVAIGAFLTPARRFAAQRLVADYPGAVVSDDRVVWKTASIVGTTEALVTTINRFVSLASVLKGRVEPLDRAITLQASGDPSEAAELLADEADEPETMFLEAHALMASGRDTAAASRLEKLSGVLPDDEQVAAWLRRSVSGPAALPEGDGSPSASEVAHLLFNPSVSLFDATREFDERFRGSQVEWQGEIARAERRRRDRDFPGGAGTKLLITVHRLGWDLYGGRNVDVVAWLPGDPDHSLTVGARVSVRGILSRVDTLMRNIYMEQARLEVLS